MSDRSLALRARAAARGKAAHAFFEGGPTLYPLVERARIAAYPPVRAAPAPESKRIDIRHAP
jgi:hypothetical protein